MSDYTINPISGDDHDRWTPPYTIPQRPARAIFRLSGELLGHGAVKEMRRTMIRYWLKQNAKEKRWWGA